MAYIMPPSPGWIGVTNCGSFTCTAPNNILMNFKYAKFSGVTRPNNSGSNF